MLFYLLRNCRWVKGRYCTCSYILDEHPVSMLKCMRALSIIQNTRVAVSVYRAIGRAEMNLPPNRTPRYGEKPPLSSYCVKMTLPKPANANANLDTRMTNGAFPSVRK